MPLTRQVWLLLAGMLALALVCSATVGTLSARAEMQAQLGESDADTAAGLALALAQADGDIARMRHAVRAHFATGHLRQVRYIDREGRVTVLHEAPPRVPRAPAWFTALVPVEAATGSAAVTGVPRGDRAGPPALRRIGVVEVSSDAALLQDALWRGCLRLAAAHAVLAVFTLAAGALLLWRLRRPFDAVIGQARAIVEGRYVTLPEPRAAELQRLTRAMNSMVARLRSMLDAQAAQVERLRREAQCDPLTGLADRAHFLGRLGAMLGREDGPAEGGLVLLRVAELGRLNRQLGHGAVDRMLRAIAQLLRPYGERVEGCFIGRLNGADFALCMPVGGVAEETAQALAAMLRTALPAFGAQVSVSLGAVELRRGTTTAGVMAAADTALARAESRGAWAVEFDPGEGDAGAARGAARALGEDAWRERLAEALAADRLKLVGFPAIDAGHGLVHLECMLRVQIEPGGPYEAAARWLPHAARSRCTPALDERAVALALRAISADGRPRCVNLSPASLRDSGYAGRLRALLFAAPPAARALWLEIAEPAAIERFAVVRDLGRQLRPCGVRWGLEHVGPRLDRLDHLYEAGFDYVKLDASVTAGVGADAQRAGFVRGTVEMLHNLSLEVYAEGVADTADARALWGCGVDGITGPWATILRADAVS